MVNPRPVLDLLAATVDLATARSVLRELIRLTDQAPVLTEEQLRFRLLTLAAYATPRSPAVPPIPGWPPVEPGPPDSAPGGQPAPHDMVQSAP
jgi:hypothetical protein